MAIYKTGSVTVKPGSATVTGSGTAFSTYVSANDLFKLTSEGTTYTVAAVVSNTSLTLSSRYANTTYQTARAENAASANTTATKVFSFTLDNTPVIQNYVSITASETFTDNGAGVLTGDGSPAGSGTVGYDDGAVSLTLGASLTATINISASYYSGDTLSGMPYQVITDFTTNYNLPEISVSDTNFQYIYTKAIRLLDTALNAASVLYIKCASEIEVTATPYGVVLHSPSGSRFRLTVSNTGSIYSTAL